MSDGRWREELREDQQHERRGVSSFAGTKIVAMCEATCILVFSLNHAPKSSVPASFLHVFRLIVMSVIHPIKK